MLSVKEKTNCCAKGGRRGMTFVTWLLPSTLLLLIPKCPLCVVAYVAVATGLGISVSTAAGVRAASIALCLGLLIFALLRTLGRFRVSPH